MHKETIQMTSYIWAIVFLLIAIGLLSEPSHCTILVPGSAVAGGRQAPGARVKTTEGEEDDEPAAAAASSSADGPKCCSQICDNTFPLHTYPKPDHLFACHRGCRLVHLIELLNGQRSHQAVTESCLSTCAEAYDDTDLRDACKIGCKNQVPLKRITITHPSGEHSSHDLSSFHFNFALSPQLDWAPSFIRLRSYPISSDQGRISSGSGSRSPDDDGSNMGRDNSPFKMFHDFCTKLVNRIASSSLWVSTRSSYTFLVGHGPGGKDKLILIQSKSETPQTQSSASASDPELVVNSYADIDNAYALDNDAKLVSANKAATKIDLAPILWTTQMAENGKKSWFSCFTFQNGGVPRWLLAFGLAVALLLVAWLFCLTSAVSSDPQSRKRVGQGSDLPFLILQNEFKNDDSILDDLCESEDSEAEETMKKVPLPEGEDQPPPYEESQSQVIYIVSDMNEKLIPSSESKA